MNRRQASLRIVHEINLGTDSMAFDHRISARKHASSVIHFEEDSPFIQEIRGNGYKRL